MRAIIALLLLFPSTLLAADLTIPAGEVVEIQSGDYDTVTVQGTWKAKRGESTAITVETIIVDGGTLDLGTPESPLCCPFSIVIKDVAPVMELPHLGAEGNVGIVAIRGGTLLAHGVPKLPFWESPSPLRVGQTELDLPDGHGWQVGDRLWIPSFKQQDDYGSPNAGARNYNPEWEVWHETPHEFREYVVASIECGKVTLDRGITEDVEPTVCFGQVTQRPLVVNLSRNICIQSQNPEGHRGHIAAAGATSGIDFRWVEVRDMGRTVAKLVYDERGRVARNEDRTPVFVPSTIGRYPLHMHHMRDSDTPRRLEGCVVDGSGISKWGMVVHQTHGATVKDCVCYNTHGAGFVNEDQNEVGGIWTGCLAGNITAENQSIDMGMSPPVDSPLRGFEGSGFWVSGFAACEDNIAVNCQHGFQYPAQRPFRPICELLFGSQTQVMTPDGLVDIPTRRFDRCKAISCIEGFEFWRATTKGSTELHDCVSANHSDRMVDPNKESPLLDGCKLSAVSPDLTRVIGLRGGIDPDHRAGLETAEAYTFALTVRNTDMDGVYYGLKTARTMNIENVRIRAGVGADLGPNGHPAPLNPRVKAVVFTGFPQMVDCALGNYAIQSDRGEPIEFVDEVPWLLIQE